MRQSKKTYFEKRNIKCDNCGHTKFKTVSKDNEYKCRECGASRFNNN